MDHDENGSGRNTTCDRCRKRKVKCLSLPPDVESEGKCKGCYNLDEPCTYNYVVKRAGRKTTRVINQLKRSRESEPFQQPEAGPSRRPPSPHSRAQQQSQSQNHQHHPHQQQQQHPHHPQPQPQAPPPQLIHTPPDPAATQFQFPSGLILPHASPNYHEPLQSASIPYYDTPYGQAGETSALSVSTSSQPDDQAALSGLLHLRNHVPPPYHYIQPNPIMPTSAREHRPSHSSSHVLQLEQVITWANASFFLRLYLKYQHALMPLVHKPSFSKDIVDRRDRTDEVFRGLLFSLITHVISQVPKSKMITHFTQPELERLQVRCHQASRTIQVKYHHEPSLELIIAHYADVAVCTTLGKTELSAVILAEAVRMAYSLGLHRPKSVLGGDFLQTQMQRRMFWILYQTDKTEASVGLPSLMPDYEGVPPMPLDVDDEFITPQGYLPQPRDRPSTMTGLAMCCGLFRTFSECLFRHRAFSYTPGTAADPESTLAWIESARRDLTRQLRSFPNAWQADPQGMEDEDDRVMYGTQRANILITAASLDFALLDLKALILPEVDIAEEREAAARESYTMLSAIPVEHLAMNGESIRGKVLRIIIALMSTTSMQDELYNQSVKDWWGILSQVQWVQVIPLDTESLLSTDSQSI